MERVELPLPPVKATSYQSSFAMLNTQDTVIQPRLALNEALRGKSDIDQDGIVTVDEVWFYVKDRTERTSRKEVESNNYG